MSVGKYILIALAVLIGFGIVKKIWGLVKFILGIALIAVILMYFGII